MKKCLLNKQFLTKRRHQRLSPTSVYDIGDKLRLVFGKPSSINSLDNNLNNLDSHLLIKLSSSVPSAFGTNNLHPTTIWCIEMLEKYLKGEKLLDVGTGAGIIIICALKLIRNKEEKFPTNFQADAFDIYQDAIKQAKTNLRLNGLEKYVNLEQNTLTNYPNNFYTLVIANLPPIAISELWLELIEKVADNGRLILSGILRHSFADLVERFSRKGFKLIDEKLTDLWCLAVLEKNL